MKVLSGVNMIFMRILVFESLSWKMWWENLVENFISCLNVQQIWWTWHFGLHIIQCIPRFIIAMYFSKIGISNISNSLTKMIFSPNPPKRSTKFSINLYISGQRLWWSWLRHHYHPLLRPLQCHQVLWVHHLLYQVLIRSVTPTKNSISQDQRNLYIHSLCAMNVLCVNTSILQERNVKA